jgi:hypothetical protein
MVVISGRAEPTLSRRQALRRASILLCSGEPFTFKTKMGSFKCLNRLKIVKCIENRIVRCEAYIRPAAYYGRFAACWWPVHRSMRGKGCVAKADDGGCAARPAGGGLCRGTEHLSLLMQVGAVVEVPYAFATCCWVQSGPASCVRSRAALFPSHGRLGIITSRILPFRFTHHAAAARAHGQRPGSTALVRRGSTR